MLKNELIKMPIFDSLVHITENGKWFHTDIDASIERLLTIFKETPALKKAFLVGLPGNHLPHLMQLANEHPDKFIPIAPCELAPELPLIEYMETLKSLGFKGIKIHPRLLNINLIDNRIIELIQCAHEKGLISLLCTIHRPPSAPIECPVSEALYRICVKTKGAKIILLHGGYYDLLATSEMIRSFDNVLLDLSTTLIRFKNTAIRETIQFLFETADQKLCIGSDFPEYTIYDVIECIEKNILLNKTIANEKLNNIFFVNLEKFMGI